MPPLSWREILENYAKSKLVKGGEQDLLSL